jgi:hypothetical protein
MRPHYELETEHVVDWASFYSLIANCILGLTFSLSQLLINNFSVIAWAVPANKMQNLCGMACKFNPFVWI